MLENIGGGYSTEAISFILSLPPNYPFWIAQHGDMMDGRFMSSLPPQQMATIRAHMWHGGPADVCICHSEPGAWALPKPKYQSSQCPPEGMCRYRIGRTVFETDRIPSVRSSIKLEFAVSFVLCSLSRLASVLLKLSAVLRLHS
jgi:hypothetical protein